MSKPLLKVEDLRVSFRRDGTVHPVVKGVSFELLPGRCVAIVGESGSGKSVTARSLVGLAGAGSVVQAAQMTLRGESLLEMSPKQWRGIRGKEIGFVLQDALVSLDPLRKVGQEVAEGLKIHGQAGNSQQTHARVVELLTQVGLPDPQIKARQLPGELSGGQRQRALIASALALDPDVLIADEPTTALDVTVQAQILALLEDIKRRGKALILISHDLAVVSRMADEVVVMRHGEVVERGQASKVFADPQHEYTRALLAAIPSIHTRGKRLSPTTQGTGSSTSQSRSLPFGAQTPVLEARQVVKRFLGPDQQWRTAVDGVSFQLRAGETLGIVGESGSGKSTLARVALALEKPDSGEVFLQGQPWSAGSEVDRRARRKNVTVIFQDPLSSFDPRWTVERILADSLQSVSKPTGFFSRADNAALSAQIATLMDQVGLPTYYRHRRPIELSGGQRQRVAIARAIAPRPLVIVCDEPVSALDVSIQAQVLDLLSDLKNELGISYLFISHDLGVVHHLSDKVLVMNRGNVVEHGTADDIFLRPAQPYTKRLLAAISHTPAKEIAFNGGAYG